MSEDDLQYFWKVRDDVLAEHAKRYYEVLKLSLVVSFGAFFFLLQVEEAFPKETRMCPLFLRLSWIFDFVSTISGSIYLIFYMLQPLIVANRASKLLSQSDSLSEQEAREAAKELTPKALKILSDSTYFGHLLFLILCLTVLAFFMIKNI